MAELYRLDFPNGKSYIGATRVTAAKRFKAHRCAARNSWKGIVYQAWRRDGEPKLVVLAVLSEEDLYAAEARAVAIFGTQYPAGYNMTPGGDIPPSLTPSVANKIREKLRGRKIPEEQKRRQAATITGRKHTAEARARMSIAQKGKFVSEAAKEKMAAAKRGRILSEEVKAKMAIAQRARRLAEGCKLHPKRWRHA